MEELQKKVEDVTRRVEALERQATDEDVCEELGHEWEFRVTGGHWQCGRCLAVDYD